MRLGTDLKLVPGDKYHPAETDFFFQLQKDTGKILKSFNIFFNQIPLLGEQPLFFFKLLQYRVLKRSSLQSHAKYNDTTSLRAYSLYVIHKIYLKKNHFIIEFLRTAVEIKGLFFFPSTG